MKTPDFELNIGTFNKSIVRGGVNALKTSGPWSSPEYNKWFRETGTPNYVFVDGKRMPYTGFEVKP